MTNNDYMYMWIRVFTSVFNVCIYIYISIRRVWFRVYLGLVYGFV